MRCAASQQGVEAQAARLQPLAGPEQAGDRALGEQLLDLARVGCLGGGGGGQRDDQVGAGQARQQSRLQHVLAPPHAYRIQPQRASGRVAAAAECLRVGGARQRGAGSPSRRRVRCRQRSYRSHRIGQQHDAFRSKPGGGQGRVVAAIQHREANVGGGRVRRGWNLTQQAPQVGRPRALGEVVDLQEHRLAGRGGRQHGPREAGVLGQVVVVHPPHAVPVALPQQVGELALLDRRGRRGVVAEGLESIVGDLRHSGDVAVRTRQHAVRLARGDHRDPAQVGE